MAEKTKTELESDKKGYVTILECDCQKYDDGDMNDRKM